MNVEHRTSNHARGVKHRTKVFCLFKNDRAYRFHPSTFDIRNSTFCGSLFILKFLTSRAAGQETGQFNQKKKLLRVKGRLCSVDFVRNSNRTRARTRRRPRRRFCTFDFEDEYEHDDEDDDNTLHVAEHSPRLDFAFFVLK